VVVFSTGIILTSIVATRSCLSPDVVVSVKLPKGGPNPKPAHKRYYQDMANKIIFFILLIFTPWLPSMPVL
jgi:hypothetical protein